jgi:putative membrane protein
MKSIHKPRLVSNFAIRFAARPAAWAVSALLLACTTAAVAQAGASDGDKHFVEAALKGGMAEVELGHLAAKKGASEDVKRFGEKMVVDHTALGDKMKAVAGEIGVTPPSMTTPSDMALKAKLELLSGDAFDKAYISAMVKDHEEDLKDFQQEVADASSPAVKTAARQGETVIAHHLAMIRKIAEAHNVSAKNSGGNPGSHGL